MGPQALLGSMGSQGKSSARAEQGPRLSQLPHFQFKEIMKRRKRQDRLGPGTYNIKDFLQETRPTSIRGICDTRDERFRDAHRDCFPGPGTYGNPYIPLDERDKRSASTKGMMDSRTAKCAPMEAVGSGLGPGTYSLRSSIGRGLQRAGGPRPCQRVSGGRPKPTGGGYQHLEQKKGTEVITVTVKSFLDELMSNENKKKGCFSTLPRDPGCPMERIFWFTLSQCPRKVNVMGPGSYNPKPIEKSAYYSQAPSWSTAKRFDRNFYHLFTGNEQHQQHVTEPVQNPVGVGRYDTSKHEKYPQKMRYQSLYQCDAQRYLSNLKRDAYLLERLKPVAKTNWCDLISAPRCPDTSEEITFPKVRWCWKAQISE
ncbi:lymphocyte expansion molecule [Strigops habroptila]|uniref:lymphocyte expansion molecule n=1 Tax=Strigops habroptila TaxID=2489341 RepID=UPI0011D02E04|nr:lymphocyte expansion molecule [Strigops habroptila]